MKGATYTPPSKEEKPTEEAAPRRKTSKPKPAKE